MLITRKHADRIHLITKHMRKYSAEMENLARVIPNYSVLSVEEGACLDNVDYLMDEAYHEILELEQTIEGLDD